MSRVEPFGSLDDFQPKTKPKPVERQQIDQIAADNDFPSRPSKPGLDAPVAKPKAVRRYTTGRNQQLNIKAKAETIALFHKLADQEAVPLGELLERALKTYQTKSR